MSGLLIHNEKITDREAFVKSCPFGALEIQGDKVVATSACRVCGVCVKRAQNGEAEIVTEEKLLDRTAWTGVAVYAERGMEGILPVSFELLGKARELVDKVGEKVTCILIGSGVTDAANELLRYGADEVYTYDHAALGDFRMEPYAAAFEDFIEKTHPNAILVGATTLGRQLAPRVAARFATGLTADCTILDMEENGDLVQIRPAFGGNIMAKILTPATRPQLATVRYKVMNEATPRDNPTGKVVPMTLPEEKLVSAVEILEVRPKEKEKTIESADIIVAAGRGVRSKEDLALVEALADALGAELAATRPLVEAGWVNPRRQIGLSGRTVRPKLIITCGISGSVQFAAGMKGAECIVAINKDENAPIFNIANYSLVGDLYDIIPKLLAELGGKTV